MEVKDYLLPLRKWWWLILATTLVAALSSFLAVRQQPAIYQSRTTLMIGRAIDDPNPTGAEFYLSQQLAQTYADIAQREPVRHETMAALGLSWLPEYAARAVPNTQLIEIAVTDTSPERAQAVANELGNQLIQLSPTGTRLEDQERQTFISQQLDNLETQIEQTQTEIQTRQDELGELFSARQIADTQNQIAALQAKLATLQVNYASLLANTRQGAINTLAVIEPATLPGTPIGPDRLLTIVTAAAIGVVLAAGAAYLLEYLDDTVKTPDDVKHLVNLPTLAGIAQIKMDEGSGGLVTARHPRSPVSEAYRLLRTGIQFATVDAPSRSLLITSANPTEGKSLTAANLAVVMAQAGYKVLLLDADLRRPTQHTIFPVSRDNGLTNLLLMLPPPAEPPPAEPAESMDNLTADMVDSRALFATALQSSGEPGLWVLPSGPIPPNPSELLGSSKMKAVLAELMSRFDILIVDSPPSLAVTDALVLSSLMDAVLLVVDAGTTRRTHLRQAVEKFREVSAHGQRAHLVGVALNRLTPRSDGYHYYYYARQSYYGENAGKIPAANGHTQSRGNGLLPTVEKDQEAH